jgi:diguanylate cyclase (GGDEF)-like protein
MIFVETFAETGLLVVAGFVLFCVPLSIVSWYVQKSQRLWLATGFWALCVVGLALTTAQIAFSRPGPPLADGWYSLRHMLFGAALLAFVWVLQELSARRQWVLYGMLAGLIVVRAVLWFSTELVWTQTTDASGNLIYGVLRGPFGMAVGVLTLTISIRAVSRPWPSNKARLLTAWLMIPTVVFATLLAGIPEATADYVTVFLFAVPVVVFQAHLLYESSVDSRRNRELSRRDGLLADFGTHALEAGGIVPAQGAVDLVCEAISDCRSEYVEFTTGRPVVIASAGLGDLGELRDRFAAPVNSQGRIVGELIVYGDLDADHALFVRSVSFVLSAAISRSVMEAEARDHALHHGLTGLPNWLLLKDRLAQLLVRRQDRAVAMLCVDVVDMKAINDEFGHSVGDGILREIARRLEAITDDRATVAHIGADEFAVAQIVDDRAQSVILSSRVSAIGHDPVEIDGQLIRFSIRVGLAVAEDGNPDPDRFIRDAEMALMQAKKSAAPLASFDEGAREEVVARRQLVRGLRDAVRKDEFFVEYQPILELATGRTVGVEALARWRTGDGRLVPPGSFIPVAEEMGMIMTITRRIFTEALAQLAQWDSERVGMRSMRMSLNLTPRVVGAPDLTPWLAELLRANDIDPHRLTLELTESALVSAPGSIVEKMTQLRNLGVSISLDDFGTGYSTLNRLMELPVSELKIDRSFVQADEGQHRAIVPGIIRLARDSGLSIVAEGIETREQLAVVLADGCDRGQGYLFAHPMAGALIPDFVATRWVPIAKNLAT